MVTLAEAAVDVAVIERRAAVLRDELAVQGRATAGEETTEQ